ncbi:MAG: C39 family peptidase [Chloroflexi bacterium]|nr:C39 family peptidase [Chloroflexota bacterium]
MLFKRVVLGAIAAVGLSACGVTPAAPIPPANVQTQPITTSAEVSPSASTAASPAASPSASAAAPIAPAASPSVAPVSAAARASAAPASPSVPPAPAGPAVKATPAAFRLQPLTYIRQTLNNCGPASIAEVLHYWGVEQTQGQAQAILRPDGNSRGMMPYPVPAYVNGLGMDGLMGIGGTPAIVKALVANGFPVIVAQNVSLQEPIAHYREIEGFDDNAQTFVSTDSYLGPNHVISYAEFDQLWKRGNQRFMVIYPPDKQPLVNAVLKSVGWDKTAVYQADLDRNLRGDITPYGPGQPQQGFPGFPPEPQLNIAWDNIQLGNIDAAKAAIASAPKTGRNQQMIGWLNQALTVPTA